MSKKSKTFFGFDQGQFLDAIQDRVQVTMNPLRSDIKDLKEGQSNPNKRLRNVEKDVSQANKKLANVEHSLSNHVTDTNKKIDKVNTKLNKLLKQ